MYNEAIDILDEILATSLHPKKRKKKKKALPSGGTAPTTKKKKTPPPTPKRKAPTKKAEPKAEKDNSPEGIVENSIGSLHGKMSMKMDTSAGAMDRYKQSLSSFAKAPSSDGNGAKSASDDEHKKKIEEHVTSALSEGMKNNNAKPEDLHNGLKDFAAAKAKNPEKSAEQILKENPGNKNMAKTALIIGGAVAAGALFTGLALISPAVAIVAGMQVLDRVSSPEISGRVLDHFLSKKDRDESGDEPQNNTRHKEEDDEDESDNDRHRQADSLLGDEHVQATKAIVDEVRSDPDTAKKVTDAINGQLEKEKNKPDMSPVQGKKDELERVWANRAEEYQKKAKDPSLSDDEKREHQRAALTAINIAANPAKQDSILKTHHEKIEQKKAEQDKNEDEDGDEGADDEPDLTFPDKKEEKLYNKAADTVLDNEDDTFDEKDIAKKHGLSEEQTKKFMDRMEKEGIVSAKDKNGKRTIIDDDNGDGDDDDEEEGDEEEPDDEPPSPKGKKVKASEQSDLDACIETVSEMQLEFDFPKNGWDEVLSLLNYRTPKPGYAGGGQDDLDSLGPAYLGPFDPTPDFNEEADPDAPNTDYEEYPLRQEHGDLIQQKFGVESLMDLSGGHVLTKSIKGPTYAALKLHPASARLLKKWCEDKGIKGVYPKGEFHITVCYSKNPIHYKPMVFTDGPKEVQPQKFDLLGREDDKKYIVLKLKKGFPHERFQYSQEMGASHDFPEYLPHISISPPGHGMSVEDIQKLNTDDLKLPFPLLVDYEYADELNARLLMEAKLPYVVHAMNLNFTKKILSKQQHSKYLVKQIEEWTQSDDGKPLKPMEIYYNNNGDYVASEYEPSMVQLFVKHDIIPEKRNSDSNVCSIGFSPTENKWYGWSHRAIFGFKVGDTVKPGDMLASSGWTDEYLEKHPEQDTRLPVGFKAQTLDDAKKMADAFAESVAFIK